MVDEPESAVRETLGISLAADCREKPSPPTLHFTCEGVPHLLLLGLMNQILMLISVCNAQKLVICEQLMIFCCMILLSRIHTSHL